ncbi:M23 family metallopeptidase [Catenovulum sp. 2E275]|uniref:M23 family metallopeptidase n=1 Tax=Catenovulum sp. 2E275 TaxID=2980497 RepID=UPI0021D25796|nr:M23 family metallopeptidase [Catenovulum sp. 2E275]MCU4674205.1 M23 family metallopeptidase [Catenovulum sp. 2E275]
MSFSIQYTKHDTQLEWRLSVRHGLAVLLLLISLASMITYSINKIFGDTEKSFNPVNQSKQDISEHKKQLIDLKQKTEVEITALKLKLAELQSYALRMNALGARVAEQADISGDEFNFAEQPATGGPEEHTHDFELQADSADFSLLNQMDALLEKFNFQEQQLHLLESVMLNHNISEQIYISGRPITSGWLSSYYGIRKDPFSGLPAKHKGIDFAGQEGSEVVATGSGVVTWAGERYGYGNLVEIDHGHGMKTRYGHNKEITVTVGEIVTKGTQIAVMGSTGRSTGPHVHYEILKNGKQIDPLKYVYRRAQ